MNKRKLKKALKRLKHLPKNKYLILYFLNKVKYFWFKAIKSTSVAYPSTVMIELTNHCNLHCTTCPREYDYGKQMDKGNMQPVQAQRIIDELWPYLDSVGLTGMGETFIYKELEEIVDYIRQKNKGIIISLSTNAMLPNFIEKVKPLVGKVDTIQVSIDGLNEIYESIRIDAKFEVLDNNLKQLVGLCSDSNTNITLNMVVTKENYHQMYSILEYTHSIGINSICFTLFNLASATNIESEYYEFYHSKPFIAEHNRIEKARTNYNHIEITTWDLSKKGSFQNCPFPWTHFYICWNGFVAPCCGKPFPKELHFGNVFKTNVINVLNSESYKEFRRQWFQNSAPSFCKKCHNIDL